MRETKSMLMYGSNDMNVKNLKDLFENKDSGASKSKSLVEQDLT